MNKILVVVDMQNDFIDGALGNPQCQAVVQNVVNKINEFDGDEVIYTMDTHDKYYLKTREGHNLPVRHCIEGTHGWELNEEVNNAIEEAEKKCCVTEIRKPTFGAVNLASNLTFEFDEKEEFEIEFVGVCTGICVISNVMLVKAFFPEANITVDASCCACVTPESHKTALEAMKLCQVTVIGE